MEPTGLGRREGRLTAEAEAAHDSLHGSAECDASRMWAATCSRTSRPECSAVLRDRLKRDPRAVATMAMTGRGRQPTLAAPCRRTGSTWSLPRTRRRRETWRATHGHPISSPHRGYPGRRRSFHPLGLPSCSCAGSPSTTLLARCPSMTFGSMPPRILAQRWGSSCPRGRRSWQRSSGGRGCSSRTIGASVTATAELCARRRSTHCRRKAPSRTTLARLTCHCFRPPPERGEAARSTRCGGHQCQHRQLHCSGSLSGTPPRQRGLETPGIADF